MFPNACAEDGATHIVMSSDGLMAHFVGSAAACRDWQRANDPHGVTFIRLF